MNLKREKHSVKTIFIISFLQLAIMLTEKEDMVFTEFFICVLNWFFIVISSLTIWKQLIRKQKLLAEMTQQLEKMNEQLKDYKELQIKYQENRQTTHEYRNQIHCLYFLMESGQYIDAKKYLSGIRAGM